jgi:hypothetical protein
VNLSQLRTQIDRRTGVRQDPLATTAYINEALNIISSRREWPWLDALQTITTTLDENTYDVSSTYSETRTVSIGGVEAVQIYIADADDFNGSVYCPDRYEYAIEWSAGTAQLLLFPMPPEGTVVTHRYTRTESLASSDTDEPLMPERYHSIICDFAAGLFLERIEPSRAEYYIARAEKGLKQMSEATQRKANPGQIRIRDGFPY